jgi:hypothetical protein
LEHVPRRSEHLDGAPIVTLAGHEDPNGLAARTEFLHQRQPVAVRLLLAHRDAVPIQ